MADFPVIDADDRERTYTPGNGSTGPLAAPFFVGRLADIEVAKLVDGAWSVLTVDTDYTVAGGTAALGGGYVSASVTLAHAADGATEYRVRGRAAIDRLTSIVVGGKYDATAIDAEIARNRIIQQENRRDADAATDAATAATAAAAAATVAADADAAAAAASASAAAASASSASASAATATTKAGQASTSAGDAATSETNAAASASAAATSASSAASSASAASTSAGTATAKAAAAATSETNAASSASAAASSASGASTAAATAAAAASAAASSYDNFDDRYLGAKSSNPSVDNDGDALLAGALYYNTAAHEMRVWSGSAWGAAYVPADAAVASFAGRTGAVTPQAGDYDASDVGLGNVTNDAQLKASALDTDGALAANSDAKVPSQKAVKTFALPASYLDTDSSFAANSDSKVPSQKAVKAAINALLAANDAVVLKGAIDCSANPNYPAADAGHEYRVSVAGKIGGASGTNVEAGDILLCITDGTASGDQATVGSAWSIIQVNLDGAVTITNLPTNLASAIHAATSKGTPVDNDELLITDSAASYVLKKLTWANLKATVKTYLDTLYQPLKTILTSLGNLSIVAGDIIYGSGTAAVARLAKGTDGQVLTLASGLPSWASPAGGMTLLGTVSTASGSSVQLTGIASATYRALYLSVEGCVGASSSYLRAALSVGGSSFGGDVEISGAAHTDADWGGVWVYGFDLAAPFRFMVPAVDNAAGTQPYTTPNYGQAETTGAATAIKFTRSTGNHNGGQIKVYGLK
jgi:hypothetical protein